MKYMILYLLKGHHQRLLDKYHSMQYWASDNRLEWQWDKVIGYRNKIRRLEPDFLIDCD